MIKYFDLGYYADVLSRYLQTGVVPDETQDTDPLLDYMVGVMRTPDIKLKVLDDAMRGRIFFDLMIQFVQQNLDKWHFNEVKSRSERDLLLQASLWDRYRCQVEGPALLEQLEKRYAEAGSGLDWAFYRAVLHHPDDAYAADVWQKMLVDWERCLGALLDARAREYLALNSADLERRIRHFLEVIPPYLKTNAVEPEEFSQAWTLMNGLWNTVDFERYRKIIRLQKVYPCLLKLAQLMGRVADDEGAKQVQASAGAAVGMNHASHSDIEGVTVGNDLNALLPAEIAQCLDDELDALFFYKFTTRKLQTFRHKSTVLQPARKLERRKARQKGAMVVCLDTSASMSGAPERIAFSQVMKLLEVADAQHRDCLLIAFSVSATPIDVKQQRARLMEIFSRTAHGDTDATRMMQTMLGVLQGHAVLGNADVLWVSDFKVPLVAPELMKRMGDQRDRGTRFYGLQIGTAPHDWEAHFDRMYQIEYAPGRRF